MISQGAESQILSNRRGTLRMHVLSNLQHQLNKKMFAGHHEFSCGPLRPTTFTLTGKKFFFHQIQSCYTSNERASKTEQK